MTFLRHILPPSTLALGVAIVSNGCSGAVYIGQDGSTGTSGNGSSGSTGSGDSSGSSFSGQASGASAGVSISGTPAGSGQSGGSIDASGASSGVSASGHPAGSGASSGGGGSSGSTSSGSGGGGSGSPDAGTSCTTDVQCGHNQVCGFPASDGCSAKGKCFPYPTGPMCLAYAAGCACDGSFVNVACNGLPSGYEQKPLLHSGACAADAGAGRDAAAGGSDAGRCCPVGWDLYSCTYAGGGAGQACHNPALGCASSLTCGSGCDFVASGRCP